MENLESGAQLRWPIGTPERQDYKMTLSHGGRQCSVNEGEHCAYRLEGRKGKFSWSQIRVTFHRSQRGGCDLQSRIHTLNIILFVYKAL